MKLSKLILILIITFIGTATVSADNRQSRKHIRKGNTLFRSDKRKEALVDYVKAVRADTTNARALYNLSTSMFPAAWRNVQENQRDTMINYFKAAAQQETNSYRKAQAYHNMGVVLQGAHDFKNAIEAYKEALRNNPNDDETRYNLVLCQRQLKNDGNGGQSQQQQQQDEQDQQQQQGGMSQQNAEQVLKAMQDRERATQQRINAQQVQQQRHERQRTNKKW
jgi:Ca-activated chloride channel family protein